MFDGVKLKFATVFSVFEQEVDSRYTDVCYDFRKQFFIHSVDDYTAVCARYVGHS